MIRFLVCFTKINNVPVAINVDDIMHFSTTKDDNGYDTVLKLKNGDLFNLKESFDEICKRINKLYMQR